MMLLKDDATRLQNWYPSSDMQKPDECNMNELCHQLKLSPQEIVECFPCVVAKINPEFTLAIEEWFQSDIQMLGTISNHSRLSYVNFCLTTDGVLTSVDPGVIRDTEKMQAKFFLNRNEGYLHRHWAKRNNVVLAKGYKTTLTAITRAKNTARAQIKATGVELKLPAPINRTFKQLQHSWVEILQPERMVVYPPTTEYEYAIVARNWLIEIESALFGEAVNALNDLEEEELLQKAAESQQMRKTYEKVVKPMKARKS